MHLHSCALERGKGVREGVERRHWLFGPSLLSLPSVEATEAEKKKKKDKAIAFAPSCGVRLLRLRRAFFRCSRCRCCLPRVALLGCSRCFLQQSRDRFPVAVEMDIVAKPKMSCADIGRSAEKRK